ncbi:phytanoyl-CoA dioxygenase family protein [uncultured Gimesia sp.]|uniref:phytanoyl-CoA dioxygenase family protein n=1 Tax=uncultured Gimesia sp. TaxID=1678688 RepID=UPI0026361005|nr:phytanoyl-CoA dioxygenase family protein [uncultured Gimesia sp.]
MSIVNKSDVSQYERDGFLTVNNLISKVELDRLRLKINEIAEGRVTTFPADQIEYEPGSQGVRDSSTIRKINRCVENEKVFMDHAINPRILDIVSELIGPDIKLFGSQCFMKPPGGIEKPYHQDSAYFTIEPRELVTCWTALDDVTLDNGCLWVIPGSHRGELLDHDQAWDIGDRVDMQVRDSQIDSQLEVPIELKAGSCSFHHSMLLHRSGPNQTQNSRRGLAIHYMSSRSRWTHQTQLKPNYLLLRGKEYDDCV